MDGNRDDRRRAPHIVLAIVRAVVEGAARAVSMTVDRGCWIVRHDDLPCVRRIILPNGERLSMALRILRLWFRMTAHVTLL